jgi:hypothetical protein
MLLIADRVDQFHLPLSARAYDELMIISSWLDGLQLNIDGNGDE